MLAKFTLISALAAAAVSAQTVSERDIDIVEAQWVNSGFESESATGFGLELDAEALLDVKYSFGSVQNGNAYSADQVASLPTFTVMPSASAAADNFFTADTMYTLMLADAASLGQADPEGNYRHYLLVNATGSATNGSFSPEGGVVVTNYAGPGPIAGTGAHRYAWMLFTQGDDATFPLPEGTSPGHWNVTEYVDQAGLDLFAASFFTVENGAPTGAVVSTSAVNTATFTESSAASSSGASSMASSASSRASNAPSSAGSAASSAAAAATSRPASSATKVGASLVGALAGMAGLVALA